MALVGEPLIIDADRSGSSFYKGLYLASSNIRPNPDFVAGQEVEGETLRKILQGAARISLGIEADGFRGIDQAKADFMLRNYFGEVPDRIPESWDNYDN